MDVGQMIAAYLKGKTPNQVKDTLKDVCQSLTDDQLVDARSIINSEIAIRGNPQAMAARRR